MKYHCCCCSNGQAVGRDRSGFRVQQKIRKRLPAQPQLLAAAAAASSTLPPPRQSERPLLLLQVPAACRNAAAVIQAGAGPAGEGPQFELGSGQPQRPARCVMQLKRAQASFQAIAGGRGASARPAVRRPAAAVQAPNLCSAALLGCSSRSNCVFNSPPPPLSFILSLSVLCLTPTKARCSRVPAAPPPLIRFAWEAPPLCS